ncbi:MAG: hypothetical protein ACP59X_10170 [Solidesulfovibrio sp. DCME]|uniref:hypothetical protein n=1 Tax=Solidesulfovibrio sp. DCME TaxID=3447380 RepID=UPI003D0FDD52
MRKWIVSSLLAICLLVVPMHGFAQQTDDSGITSLFDVAAYVILKVAWPTAKYKDWEFERVRPLSNGQKEVVIKINAKSFWNGGPLWLQVITKLDEDYNIIDLHFGDYKGVFPPGSALKALKAASEANSK